MSTMQSLERAVLETLVYSDIFNFPLRWDELIRYLPMRVKKNELTFALDRLNGQVTQKNGYYHLSGRSATVAIRESRENPSRRSLKWAFFYGRILSALPFIRMVGITGSLAVLNCENTADLDFLLVTRTGRVWFGRACALLLNRVTRLFGHTICPNVILSESSIKWNREDLYSAREICQMIPVRGQNVYASLRATNSWTKLWLPNTDDENISIPKKDKLTSAIQAILEYPFRGNLGDRLEAWEMKRKIARLSRQSGYGLETNFNENMCQGNFDQHGEKTRMAFEKKLEELNLLAEKTIINHSTDEKSIER